MGFGVGDLGLRVSGQLCSPVPTLQQEGNRQPKKGKRDWATKERWNILDWAPNPKPYTLVLGLRSFAVWDALGVGGRALCTSRLEEFLGHCGW